MARREASRFLVRVLRSRYRDHRVELSQFKRHIRRGASVCDVGAHKGSFLFWLARWCSPGRAIAFEPQPDLASELERVCAKFSLDNVVIERKAAHSTSGSKQFFIPDGRKAGASLLKPDMTFQAMDVEAIALDEYFKPTEDVAAIKIDVEGSELDVLLGAQRTINRCMPLLVVECDRHLVSMGRMHDTFSFLKDLGYSAGFVNKGRILPLSRLIPSSIKATMWTGSGGSGDTPTTSFSRRKIKRRRRNRRRHHARPASSDNGRDGVLPRAGRGYPGAVVISQPYCRA